MKTARYALAALMLAAAPAAVAQEKAPAPIVAVVDGNKLFETAKSMKSAREEADKLRDRFRNELVAEERKLQAEWEALQKQRSVITGAEYDRRAQIVNNRLVEARRTAQIREQQLALSARQLQIRFRDEVINIVKALSVEQGFNLVFDRGAILHSVPAFDITNSVLERLDKSPPIKFEFPPKAEVEGGAPPAPPAPPGAGDKKGPAQPPKK